MKIFVRIKPNSKVRKVEKTDDHHFTVWVKEPARQQQANQAMIEALNEYFKVGVSRFTIISGRASRQKIIEIK